MRKASLLVVLVAALVAAVAAFGTGNALAYGPRSVAQVEISGNCNNPSWCNANFGGTGGLWIWASLNNDVSHSVDFTFNGCGHSVGNVGPRGFGSGGSGGGGPRGVPGNGNWTIVSSVLVAVFDNAFPLDVAVTSTGAPDLTVQYYEINLGGFVVAAPVPVGHYSVSGLSFKTGSTPPPGVNFQTQVAP
jgi:hypothetical protein